MKKLITTIFIMIAVSSLFSQQAEFPRGVFLFGLQPVDFQQMHDSLFINYFQTTTNTLHQPVPAFITNGSNLNVVAGSQDVTIQYSRAQQLIFQAEDELENPLTHTYWDYKHPNGLVIGDFFRVVKNGGAGGYMVQDAVPDYEYGYNRTNYSATFRMRITKDVAGNPPPVADLIVYCKYPHNNELARVTLYYNNFLENEVSQDFEVPFTLETSGEPPEEGGCLTGGDESLIPSVVTCKNIDMRVYWYGEVTTWLDNAIIMDTEGSDLFAGVYDSTIIEGIAPYTNNDYPLLKRFYTVDEPRVSAFLPFNYVDNLFKSAGIPGITEGRGRGTSAMPHINDKSLWLMQDAQPHEYFFDTYVIDSDVPSPSMTDEEATEVGVVHYNNDQQYTDEVQDRLDIEVERLMSVAGHCKDNDIPLWFTPQLHGIYYRPNQQYRKPDGNRDLRPPTGTEIWAMSNIGIAFGATSIFPYPYGTDFWHTGDGTQVVFPGLVSQNKYNNKYVNHWGRNTVIDGKTVFTGYSEKWDALASLNQKLLTIEDELLTLSWQDAYSIHLSQGLPVYLTDIKAFNLSGVQDNYPSSTFIELGEFKKANEENNDNLEYFFIVNRRTLQSDSRNIRIQYDKSSSNPNNFYNWTVKEIGTTNYWSSASPTNQFTTTYEPGDGKLFKLQPTVISGGDLLYNETINSDIELHGDLVIQGGVTLTVNADYNCYGNIYLKEGSKIEGTGRIYFHDGSQIVISQKSAKIWGQSTNDKLELDFTNEEVSGISVRNGGAIDLKYCEVKNALTGVSTFHSSNSITAEYCTFDNITDYGISVGNNNTDLDVEHCIFDNCGSYCINIAGSADSAPYIYNNTFTNSYGAISAININQVVFIVNDVEDSEIGVYGSNVTSFVVISNTFDSDQNSMPGVFFESCGGVIAGNTITGYTNGISLGNSSPYIGQNVVTYNLYHALTLGSGSNPDMSGQTFYEGYNTFQNNGNSTTGTDGSEIYFGYNSNANMSRGCNSIIDDRCPPNSECNIQDYPVQLLMNSQGLLIPITVEAEYNYWGNSQYYDLEDRFGNLRIYYEPYYGSPCTYEELSGGENLYLTTSDGRIVDTTQVIETDSLSATETLYFEALENFLTADYESAETICNQIVNSVDTLFAKLSAYQMLYYIGNIESKPASYFTNLYNVFSGLSQSTSDSLLIKMFTQLGSLSLIGKQEYTNAIEEFNDVIEQNPNTEEAVFAEIDALTTGLLIENDTTLGKTNVGKYLVKPDEYQDRIKNILKKNFGVKQIIETTESVPKQYHLYQNYPNPFNPVTTIRYDIVKAQNVKVTIFDILGREVTTLVNTQQQPGTYTITWDASNAASGIYFYQLKTKDYVDTKKMILLK